MAGESGEWKCDPEIIMPNKEWRDCEKLREVHGYIEMVEEIVRPGCSPEVLKIALASVTDLVDRLSSIPSQKVLRCSL